MGSAMDSGVDTGNDSNDSSVQEKLSKMDEESTVSKMSDDDDVICLVGPVKETSPEGGVNPNSCVIVKKKNPKNTCYCHTPGMLHGYIYNPDNRTLSPETLKSVFTNMMNLHKEIGGVFIPHGPCGLHYQNSQLVTKMGRMNRASRIAAVNRTSVHKIKCSRSLCPANYTRFRDTLRMCRAASHNNTDAVKELLEQGTSPNCHDGYRRSPLHLAACMGFADMVKLLLEHGADPNAKDSLGNTPLHLAACTNHVKVITLLLKAGTRVSERDLGGHSPLQLAITKFNIIKRSAMPHPALKEQVCQVITMLTEYMKRREGATIDTDLLNRFESLVRVSDSSEEVESNVRDLLDNLSSLSLSST